MNATMETPYDLVSRHRNLLKIKIREALVHETELIPILYQTLAYIETRGREKGVFGEGMYECTCGHVWSATEHGDAAYSEGEICPECNSAQ